MVVQVELLLFILVNFSIALIVTISLNLEVGFLGLPQFGRVLAVIIGALIAGGVSGRIVALMLGLPYGVDYTSSEVNFKVVSEINRTLSENPLLSILALVITIVLAGIAGGVIGYITAYPAIRLKAAYLGITLLAFGDIAQVIAYNYEPLAGGTRGVFVIDPFSFVGPERRFLAATLIITVIALLSYAFVEYLTRSPYGRLLRAARDAEIAAETYGVDIVKLRAQVLIIGGALASIAGSLYTLYSGGFFALTYTRLTWTFWPWAFMMLGGAGNNLGVLVGVLIYSIVYSLIILYKGYIAMYVGIDPAWLEYIFIGLILVLIPLFRPQGLIPEKPIYAIPKQRIESIIASYSESREEPLKKSESS